MDGNTLIMTGDSWRPAAVSHLPYVTCYNGNVSSAGVCYQEGPPLPHPSSERSHGVCDVCYVM
jgi:hypothetical protein